jgi:hypothetical protein
VSPRLAPSRPEPAISLLVFEEATEEIYLGNFSKGRPDDSGGAVAAFDVESMLDFQDPQSTPGNRGRAHPKSVR